MSQTPVVRPERVLADLAELSLIGRTASGGVRRLAWTAEDEAARRWLEAKLAEFGAQSWRDGAGNVFGCLADCEGPYLTLGSHLDSVPDGGHFDGPLGVTVALECLRALAESGQRQPLQIVSFAEEEGSRYGFGLYGSRALIGGHTEEDLRRARDRDGVPFLEAAGAYGVSAESVLAAGEGIARVRAYLELHIEQGPRLERRGLPLGVVSAITGIRQWSCTYRGQANHSGTTAIVDRRDALLAAAEAVLAVREVVRVREEQAVATVGMLSVHPGAANVVPGEVTFSVEMRAPSAGVLDAVEAQILERLEAIAQQHAVTLERHRAHDIEAAPCDKALVAALVQACASIQGEVPELVSWAGHDAQNMARRVPAAMLFVRSRDGISHSPREYTADDDVADALRALSSAAYQLLGL